MEVWVWRPLVEHMCFGASAQLWSDFTHLSSSIHSQTSRIDLRKTANVFKTSHSVFNFKYFPKTSFCEKVSAELFETEVRFMTEMKRICSFIIKKQTKQQQKQQQQHGVAT